MGEGVKTVLPRRQAPVGSAGSPFRGGPPAPGDPVTTWRGERCGQASRARPSSAPTARGHRTLPSAADCGGIATSAGCAAAAASHNAPPRAWPYAAAPHDRPAARRELRHLAPRRSPTTARPPRHAPRVGRRRLAARRCVMSISRPSRSGRRRGAVDLRVTCCPTVPAALGDARDAARPPGRRVARIAAVEPDYAVDLRGSLDQRPRGAPGRDLSARRGASARTDVAARLVEACSRSR